MPLLGCLALGGMSATALAQTTVTQEHVVYTLETDHYVATRFDQSAGSVDTLLIADAVDGMPVTRIADNAFDATLYSHCNQIRYVRMGQHIAAIGHDAFFACAQMEGVELSEALLTIGNRAFYSCARIKALTLPEGLTTVGREAFLGIHALVALDIPASVQTLEAGAFDYCLGLRSLTVRGGGLHIGSSAFSQNGLTSIRFMDAPPVLEEGAFYGVGTVASPVSVFVPVEQLQNYIALMKGEGRSYGWQDGNGVMTLRAGFGGLRYDYVAATSSTPAHLSVSGIDGESLINNGTEEAPAYLAQGVVELQHLSVTTLSDKAAFGSVEQSSRIYAIDLSMLPLTGVTVDRTSGRFAQVSANTLIYLPAGNDNTAPNVVVGGRMAGDLRSPIGALFSEEAVLNGRATWSINNWWKLHLFGQEVGTDEAPLLLAHPERQEVWRALFHHQGEASVSRYANTGKTVTLPQPAELDISEGQALSFYAADDIDQRFTAATPLSEDVDVYVYYQTAQLSISADTLTFLMSQRENVRTQRLTTTQAPELSRPEVDWTSADPAIVSVEADGTVKALKAGHTVVTATSKDNPAVQAACRITVVPQPESASFDALNVTLQLSAIEETHYQLQWHVYPEEAIQDMIFESQNEEVATVDEKGVVTALSVGNAVISASPVDNRGIHAICYLRVLHAADSLWISNNAITLLPGETKALTSIVLPRTAGQQVTWSSADPAVATVSADGLVTAYSGGVTEVTAVSSVNPALTAVCRVTVYGEGVTVTVDDIDYEVTSFTDESLTMKVTRVGESHLGGNRILRMPEGIRYKDTEVRFKVTAVAADAISGLRENALVFIPNTMTYTGDADNVIFAPTKGGAYRCRRLVIDENYTFAIAWPFTADEVVYERTVPGAGRPFTVSLPYSLRSSAAGARFFDLKRAEGQQLTFQEVGRTEAYKPYLAVTSQQTSVDLGGKDIAFPAMERIMTVVVGDYRFVPNARRITADEAEVTDGYVPDGLSWTPMDGDYDMMPLTAWLHAPGATALTTVLIEDENAAIRQVTVDSSDDAMPIYDLSGRYVGCRVADLPRGVYIRNGMKFTK